MLEGRLTWPFVYTDDGGAHSGSDDGINVKGNGHVVCHNQIVGFGDAMKVEQPGARGDEAAAVDADVSPGAAVDRAPALRRVAAPLHAAAPA